MNADALKGDVLRGAAKQIAVPADVVAAAREIVGLIHDGLTSLEAEKTKRTEIEAKRDLAVRSIKASEHVLRTYLDQTFAERKEAVRALFGGIDTALANGDNDALRTMVGGVVDLVRQSPIGPEIRDLTTAFADPAHIWEI